MILQNRKCCIGTRVTGELGDVKRHLCSNVQDDWHLMIFPNCQWSISHLLTVYLPVSHCAISEDPAVNMACNSDTQLYTDQLQVITFLRIKFLDKWCMTELIKSLTSRILQKKEVTLDAQVLPDDAFYISPYSIYRYYTSH